MGITPQQLRRMEERLRRPARSAIPLPATPVTPPFRRHAIVLGLDPSLRGTGYGVIRLSGHEPEALGHGTISCPSTWLHSRCLLKIHQEIREVLKRFEPTVCVVEGIFYAQNLQTAMIMGEARGAALAVLAEFGLDIYEIAPRKVKQAIVGYGGAQKLAVAKMVQRMLRLAAQPAPDAADALALALAHAQEQMRYALVPPKQV